ncbi:hypothetical protein LINPERHAP2_LOCUS14282 [Linum perenne]
MDSSEYPVTRSPRKELQGPRPPTLKVRRAMSLAARYATIEKARSLKDKAISSNEMGNSDFGDFFMEGVDMGERLPSGILSLGPGSLQPISPSFFCPLPTSAADLSFFHVMSPVGFYSSSGFLEGGLLLSPSNFIAGFSSHQANSPFSSIDLFNNFSSDNFDF